MYIKDIRLIGYAGIFNGLGVKDLYINLGKGLFIIIGDNGSGKSTLLDALSPNPDDNKCFIPEEHAEKILNIVHNDITYNIRCVHSVNNKGQRETAKIYFDKIDELGNRVELNPNGNVGSYKEVLYDEFTLDSNFLALSALSSMKKGIGMLTSAERKKYVNSIIDCLSSYNNIYKALTKRSNIFKSMVNNITNKIHNIGDEEKLTLSLTSIENRINTMMTDKDKFMIELAGYQSKVELLDPNKTIQDSYNKILIEMNEVNSKYDALIAQIQNTLVNNFKLDKNTSFEEVIAFNNKTNERYSELEVKVRVEESSILSLITDRDSDAKEIQEKVAKLDALQLGIGSFDSVKTSINTLKRNILNNESTLSSIGISLDTDISKEEFIIGIETLNNIRETILAYKSDKEYGLLEKSLEYITNSITIPNNNDIDIQLDSMRDRLQLLTIDYNKYMGLQESLNILLNRPSNCTISECSFIKTALENESILKSVDLNQIKQEIDQLTVDIKQLESDKSYYNELRQYINVVNNIIRDIKTHSNILCKLPIDTNTFFNIDNMIKMITGGYQFPEIQVLYENIQFADLIQTIKDDKQKLSDMENEYELYKSKYAIIDEITNQINDVNRKLSGITELIETKQKEIAEYKNELNVLNTMKMCFNNIFNLFNEKKNIENRKNELLSSFNNIRNDMIIIKESLDKISLTNDKISYIDKELIPILRDRDNIRFSLGQLKEYKAELEEFSSKYQKVETIKHYCSPSKDGIQNVFIELYMNTTLQLTNEILSMLFNGEYMVGEFVINEKEFRIPVFGNGLPNDDISSMSNAQISMISMIMSFVMLNQSSSKYNIIRLDEIDSMLDTNNRLQFTFVFQKIRTILGIEQSIMISHNNETDLSEASLIIFKTQDYDKYQDYNVIFNINK